MGILVQSDTAEADERKHIQNSSGNHGTVKSNPAKRKHIQIQVGIRVQSDTTEAERKHIRNSSRNPGTVKDIRTQAHSEFKLESGYRKVKHNWTQANLEFKWESWL